MGNTLKLNNREYRTAALIGVSDVFIHTRNVEVEPEIAEYKYSMFIGTHKHVIKKAVMREEQYGAEFYLYLANGNTHSHWYDKIDDAHRDHAAVVAILRNMISTYGA